MAFCYSYLFPCTRAWDALVLWGCLCIPNVSWLLHAVMLMCPTSSALLLSNRFSKAPFLFGLSSSSVKTKKKKESCWVACTLPRCSSSRFWGWWNSLAKEQKSSLSEALLDMKHLGSYASDPYRTLKMFASCLVGLVGSEMSWVWYFVSNAKFLIKPQKKTSATLHLSSLLGKSWSLASKYLSKLPIWDALMTLLFLLCVSSCAPTLWRVVKGEGLTHGVVSWALWFISFYSYTELLVKV